jgi:hypothetical protein
MKRLRTIVLGLCFCSLTMWAAPKDQTWTGWISDSKCGAKGASASHAGCAKKCIGAGEKPVLVSDNDGKVVAIDNPDAVQSQVGDHVQVSGTMNSSGALHVDKVQQQSQ